MRYWSKLDRGQKGVIFTFFLTLALVTGPSTASLFVLFSPWIKDFGWTHAQVGEIASIMGLTAGLLSPAVGWLADRAGVHRLMAVGFGLFGISYWMASHAHSHPMMVWLYAVMGLAGVLTSFLPMMVVLINWFEDKRGMASGVASVGMSVGLTLTPPIFTWALMRWGWRAALRFLAGPPVLILLPLTLVLVRTRPPSSRRSSAREEIANLPGLEVITAVGTVTFWMLMATQFLSGLGVGMVLPHQITYLIGVGYKPESAAWIFSAQTAVNAFGIILTGYLSDRYGPRASMGWSQIWMAVSVIALLAAADPRLAPLMLPIFAILWGSGAGCFNNLLPILVAETLGVRRLGTLIGFKFLASAIAMGIGPWLSGALFDWTRSYTLSFSLAAAIMVTTTMVVAMVPAAKGHDEIPAAAAGIGAVKNTVN